MRFKRLQYLDEFLGNINARFPKMLSAKIQCENSVDAFLEFMKRFDSKDVECSMTDEGLELKYSDVFSEKVKNFYETHIKDIYGKTTFINE